MYFMCMPPSLVSIMMTKPIHRVVSICLISTLWSKIQPVISSVEEIQSAGKGGVGMKDASCIFREETCPRHLVCNVRARCVVVNGLPRLLLSRCERHSKIKIEIRLERRHPLKGPAHSVSELF